MILLQRPLLAVLIVATLLSLAGGAALMQARPRSWLVPVAYWLALAEAAAVTLWFTVAAVTSGSVGDVVAATAWVIVLGLVAFVFQRQANRIAVARRALARLQMVRWSAYLGPIGVPSDDDRMLPAGDWGVPEGGAPLWIPDPDSPLVPRFVGIVDRVWSDGERVMANGRIAAAAQVDGLTPEPSVKLHPGGGGTVTSVRLGDLPVFAGVWLHVDRGGPR